MPIELHPLVHHVPWWLLVLFRLAGIFVFSPMFGSPAVPPRVKILLTLGLSACVYPALLGPGGHPGWSAAVAGAQGLTLWTLAVPVASELLIGLAIGYGATLPLVGVQLGGRMIDQQMGMGLAAIFNPELNEEAGIVSQLYFTLALAVFVILGGHRILMTTLVGSFTAVPPGGFFIGADVFGLLLGMLSSAFDLGLRVAAPVLCLMFLETVAMGFIAKTVPQMNILSVGFVLRIIAGAVVVVGVISGSFEVYVEALGENLQRIAEVFAA